jgi:hypothetical protein
MRVSGPITGGTHGWPFAAPMLAQLEAHGYRLDEYVLEGEATRYRPLAGSELGRDGRWQIEPAGSAPYRTRVLVLRPEDPARFNGTVLVNWNNVSAGYENLGGGDSPEVLEGGYAFVAVSAQRVGVHGLPDNPQGLVTWDPERYGTLSVASDDDSYDIFTQAARSVGPDRAVDDTIEGPDPLGGLEVRRLVAQGASQSAARLATYLNAVQPRDGLFDAFFLLMYFGGGTPLEVGDALMTVAAAEEGSGPLIPEGCNVLRDDLEVRVMVVNTECEATSCFGVRQPDTEHYRYWEIAGASHVTLQGIISSGPRMERDFGFSISIDDALRAINQVSPAPVVDAALHHLEVWLTDDVAPPVQPLIAFAGDPPAIVRDADGIAVGGIRLPAVAVPVGLNSAEQRSPDIFSRLVGRSEPFPVDDVRARYGDRDGYLDRYRAALDAAVSASVVLPRDVEGLLDEARRESPL